MSSLLSAALGRSGTRAGRPAVKGQTEDDETVTGEGTEDDMNAEGEGDEPEAEGEGEDPEAEGEDEDYTASDEGSEEEMAASMRGARRVLAIVGSPAGRANLGAALKLAGNAKLSAAEAVDLLGDMKADASAKPGGTLNTRLRGKAKALAPDGPAKPATGAGTLNDRMAARNAAHRIPA